MMFFSKKNIIIGTSVFGSEVPCHLFAFLRIFHNFYGDLKNQNTYREPSCLFYG